ncbi:AT HOOK MOTIF DNA-BINDING FAMILY PROTEIN [Salix koriyanagi]|uniref:AT-hook motif nuclear-localized protein n=1 Tax=Salix koriyanagi TaxID=2511006 RepID=A0A9Q0Q896_9ROSI|nr:AT HOOK MOTIF DNA-BINDING FAMILY PROTEIN [Salix koriyanagi]
MGWKRKPCHFLIGSSPYHIHRGSGFLGPRYGSQHGVSHAAPAFRSLSNPHLAAQSNPGLSSTVPSIFNRAPNVNFGQDINVAATSDSAILLDVAFSPHVISIGVGERPRAICILSGTGAVSSVTLRQPASSESSITYEVQGSKIRRKSKHLSLSGNASRDRMEKKLQLKMDQSENAFGQVIFLIYHSDEKMEAPSRRKLHDREPNKMCIVGFGSGHFEILCLSGSYLVAEDGGPHNRTGGISASLSSPDGHVIGGALAMLIAASPVQVVVCSFVYGVSKDKQSQPSPKRKRCHILA